MNAAWLAQVEDTLKVQTATVLDLSEDGRFLVIGARRLYDNAETNHRRYGDPTYFVPAMVDLQVIDTRSGATEKVGKGLMNVRQAAVRDVDAIYTDVWTSMGQEVEYAERKKTFKRYQVTEAMMALARPEALFMHCLPAHRGEEVSDEVIESSISVVFDQAENRLHAQKALLIEMLT